MVFYISLILTMLFILCWTPYLKNKSACIVYFFYIAGITFISIFRNNIGLDYFEYQRLYDIVEFNIRNIQIDPVFSLVSELLRELGCKSQMMFAVYAVFTMLFIYKGCQYYANGRYNISLLFVIVYCINDLFWLGSFNLIRQMLAVSIVFYASKYIFTNNQFKFLSWVGIASLCHYTAVASIVLWMLNRIKMKKITWFILLIVVFVLAETGLYTFLIGQIHSLLGNRLGDYELYFTEAYMRESFLQGGSGIGVLLNFSIYMVLVLVARREDKVQNFVINCIFVGVFIWIIASNITPMLRMRLYFWIFTPLIYAYNFKVVLNYKKVLLIYTIVIMSILTLYDIRLIESMSNNQNIVHDTNTNINYKVTLDFVK